MNQEQLPEIGSLRKVDQLSHTELAQRYEILYDEVQRLVRENYQLRNLQITDNQLKLITEEQIESLNQALYGASSERLKNPSQEKKPKSSPGPRIKKPSERYPRLPVREVRLTIDPAPGCEVCGQQMSDSGMTEDSEQLTVIPKKYEIVRTSKICLSVLLPELHEDRSGASSNSSWFNILGRDDPRCGLIQVL
jgi:hypothetical protein